MDGRRDRRTNKSPPVFYRTLSPSGLLSKNGQKLPQLCILDYFYSSLTNKCLIISYLGPDLGFERLELRCERTDLGFKKPNLGFKRPDFGS